MLVESYGTCIYYNIDDNCLLHVFSTETAAMPGRGGKGGAGLKPKKHFKAKQQKKRVFRSKDPILAVLMWGVQHSVRKIAISATYTCTCMQHFIGGGGSLGYSPKTRFTLIRIPCYKISPKCNLRGLAYQIGSG